MPEPSRSVHGRPLTEWASYWFAKLEKAVEEGDHRGAAVAQAQLARLGVRVNYGLKPVEVNHAN